MSVSVCVCVFVDRTIKDWYTLYSIHDGPANGNYTCASLLRIDWAIVWASGVCVCVCP